MAARSSTSLVRTVRASAPVIKVSVPRAVTPKVKRKGRRRSSAGAVGSSKNLMATAIGAAVFGWVEASDLGKSLPTIPALGRKGSLALASYFVAKNFRSPLAWDVCTAAVALSAYEFAKEGKISGDSLMGYDDDGDDDEA